MSANSNLPLRVSLSFVVAIAGSLAMPSSALATHVGDGEESTTQLTDTSAETNELTSLTSQLRALLVQLDKPLPANVEQVLFKRLE